MKISRREALARMAALGTLAFVRPRAPGAVLTKPFEHPDPRPGVTAEHVLGQTQLGKRSKKVYAAYDAARAHPEIFDGLYCACDCKTSMSHRSLLACYESMQPTGCMSCEEQALFVDKLAQEGKSLAEIRSAVDKEYG